MNVRLTVSNIPLNLRIEELRDKFKDFKGFIDCRIIYNERNESLYGILEFMSYECAEYAKKLM